MKAPLRSSATPYPFTSPEYRPGCKRRGEEKSSSQRGGKSFSRKAAKNAKQRGEEENISQRRSGAGKSFLCLGNPSRPRNRRRYRNRYRNRSRMWNSRNQEKNGPDLHVVFPPTPIRSISQRRGGAEGLEGWAFPRLSLLPFTADGTPRSASMPSLPA